VAAAHLVGETLTLDMIAVVSTATSKALKSQVEFAVLTEVFQAAAELPHGLVAVADYVPAVVTVLQVL
jgi:hypothetical protein